VFCRIGLIRQVGAGQAVVVGYRSAASAVPAIHAGRRDGGSIGQRKLHQPSKLPVSQILAAEKLPIGAPKVYRRRTSFSSFGRTV